MSRLKVKPLFEKSNYQTISELGKIKDTFSRHMIIFYDSFLGSYNIRLYRPNNFKPKREISSAIYEANEIAMQRQRTLDLLENNVSVERILKKLQRKISGLDIESIERKGLYGKMVQIYNYNYKIVVMAGEKIEKIFLEHPSKMKDDEREKAMLFCAEAGYISKVLSIILGENLDEDKDEEDIYQTMIKN